MVTERVNDASKTVPLTIHRTAKQVQEAIKPFVKRTQGGLVFDKATLSGEQVKNVFTAIQDLSKNVNGQATPEEHEFLQNLLTSLKKEETIPAQDVQKLFNVADRVANLTPVDKTGQGYLFDTGEELKKDETKNEDVSNSSDPLNKILKGVTEILTREVTNLNSEIGWMMKAYCKLKGITIDEKTINETVTKFVSNDFRNQLTDYVKAKASGKDIDVSGLQELSDNEKTALKWIGKSITIASKVPSWVFDGVAFFGAALDWTAEILHRIPIIGGILKIPFVRKLITGSAQFFGRFSNSVALIAEGARELTGNEEKVEEGETPKNPPA